MSVIKQKIWEMLSDKDDEIIPKEFDNLILDDVQIGEFTLEDKAYLEEFVNMDLLGMNQTKLRSLKNFPNTEKLKRLELNDNNLKGDCLADLSHLKNLKVLKLAANNIETLEDLEALKCHTELENLDLLGNPVCKVEGYREKVFAMLASLQVLDQVNK